MQGTEDGGAGELARGVLLSLFICRGENDLKAPSGPILSVQLLSVFLERFHCKTGTLCPLDDSARPSPPHLQFVLLPNYALARAGAMPE